MDLFQQTINSINDVLWSYVMIYALIACALYFTIRTRFAQFRLVGDMFRQLFASGRSSEESKGKKRISSFQA
ncbi:MAG: sodium:alanine symporter family protein, partial [Rikenellaceae bacterium]|nr:sodium:alanine symporter family protein [Rikenellaceae bacterium]